MQKPEPKQQVESYLREPPPITPRQSSNVPPQREPEPEPPKPKNNITIYLEKYCPLTLAQVKKDRNHLVKFKSLALKQFSEEMREIGIDSVSDQRGVRFSELRFGFNLRLQNSHRTRRVSPTPTTR